MWKSDKPNPAPTTVPPTMPPSPEKKEFRPMDMKPDAFRAPQQQDVAHIGKSVLIKGELSGSEDLFLDGEVEGSIDLQDHSLTIGPHGRVRANVMAKDVVVHGKVDGNVMATDRVELKRTAVLMGDISTQRIVIEDGAFFKGAIDIRKENKPAAKAEPARAMAAVATTSSSGFTPQG